MSAPAAAAVPTLLTEEKDLSVTTIFGKEPLNTPSTQGGLDLDTSTTQLPEDQQNDCRHGRTGGKEAVEAHYVARAKRLTKNNRFSRSFQVRVVNKRVFKSKKVVFLDCIANWEETVAVGDGSTTDEAGTHTKSV